MKHLKYTSILFFTCFFLFTACQNESVPSETVSAPIPIEDETPIANIAEPLPEIFPHFTEIATGNAIVTIAKSKENLAENITQEEIETMVRTILTATEEFDQLIQNGQTVVIKPNLVQMHVDSTGELLAQEVNGITTDWRVTNAVVKMVREKNPDGKIYIVEGSASGPTSQVMAYYHYTPEYIDGVDGFISLEEDCGSWQDFDAPEITKVTLVDGLLHDEYYFSTVVYETDVLISIPCLKTSSGVVVTAGIKNVSLGTPPGNIYGVSPEDPGKTNMVSHSIVDGELDKWIYDYYMAKPIDYVIVDGLQGFQSGPVPMSGERTHSDQMNMGVILGGKDAVAVDTVCALITGWDPQSVGYLNHFKDHGVGFSNIENIHIHGNFVDDLRKYFTIKRPDLGGLQITDTTGPLLEVHGFEAKESPRELALELTAGEDAVKLEIYCGDTLVQYISEITEPHMNIKTALPILQEPQTVSVIAYDRFLNKTIQQFIVYEH